MLRHLYDKVDLFLVGGILANTFFKARGDAMHASVTDDSILPEVKKYLGDSKIILPTDWISGDDGKILDLGPESAATFAKSIAGAKLVIWNGPMGYFEDPRYRAGSLAIAEAIVGGKAFSVVGGGETETKRRAKGLCHKCYRKLYAKKRAERDPQWRSREGKKMYQKHKTNYADRQRERHRNLKWLVIEQLGGKCACCGETTMEFLTVDHINGDGAAHRKSIANTARASSLMIYKDIRNQGFPRDKYRVLCFNCNCSIGCWGYCPHTHSRTTKYPIRLGSPLPKE
jgi:hypothetical protein